MQTGPNVHMSLQQDVARLMWERRSRRRSNAMYLAVRTCARKSSFFPLQICTFSEKIATRLDALWLGVWGGAVIIRATPPPGLRQRMWPALFRFAKLLLFHNRIAQVSRNVASPTVQISRSNYRSRKQYGMRSSLSPVFPGQHTSAMLALSICRSIIRNMIISSSSSA